MTASLMLLGHGRCQDGHMSEKPWNCNHAARTVLGAWECSDTAHTWQRPKSPTRRRLNSERGGRRFLWCGEDCIAGRHAINEVNRQTGAQKHSTCKYVRRMFVLYCIAGRVRFSSSCLDGRSNAWLKNNKQGPNLLRAALVSGRRWRLLISENHNIDEFMRNIVVTVSKGLQRKAHGATVIQVNSVLPGNSHQDHFP